MLVNIDIKGKGLIKNKIMRVEGSDITLEGLAGAWFWIKKEGCLRIGKVVYHTGDYDPEKEILCSIVPAEGEKLNKLSPHDSISLNNLQFERFDTGEEIEEEFEERENLIDERVEEGLQVEEQKAVAPDAEKSALEDEIEKLGLELKSVRREYENAETTFQQELDEAKQRIIKVAVEKDELENETAELKRELEHSERMKEAYKNRIEQVKIKMEETLTEYKLTMHTYESILKEKRDTLTKINRWMSKVAGMDEKINPNEKAAKIEKLVLERWNILEENKKLKVKLKRRGAESAEKKRPPEKQKATEDAQNKKIESAFKYVVVSIHMASMADRDGTLDKIDTVLNRFQIIDPAEVDLTEKDILIIKDYFDLRSRKYAQADIQDMITMVNFFKDEVEKILGLPEFSEPSKRVGFRQELKEAYDEYMPESKR